MAGKAPVSGKRPFRMIAGISRVEDLANGYSVMTDLALGAKTVYYVDSLIGSNGNDGLSWDAPLSTLANALSLSHADIGSGSNGATSRNVIFIRGTFTEDLVSLAKNTTVVGVGSISGLGSAQIKGVQTIVGTTWVGCWFYNVDFIPAAGTVTMITLPSGLAGVRFVGCRFMSGAATTTGISTTVNADLRIIGCEFLGSWNAFGFTTASLSLAGAASHRTVIDGNRFENVAATGNAILVASGFTGNGCFISNNHIYNAAKAILDTDSIFYAIGNRVVVGTAKAAGTSVTLKTAGSMDNIVTGSDGTIHVPVETA